MTARDVTEGQGQGNRAACAAIEAPRRGTAGVAGGVQTRDHATSFINGARVRVSAWAADRAERAGLDPYGVVGRNVDRAQNAAGLTVQVGAQVLRQPGDG